MIALGPFDVTNKEYDTLSAALKGYGVVGDSAVRSAISDVWSMVPPYRKSTNLVYVSLLLEFIPMVLGPQNPDKAQLAKDLVEYLTTAGLYPSKYDKSRFAEVMVEFWDSVCTMKAKDRYDSYKVLSAFNPDKDEMAAVFLINYVIDLLQGEKESSFYESNALIDFSTKDFSRRFAALYGGHR